MCVRTEAEQLQVEAHPLERLVVLASRRLRLEFATDPVDLRKVLDAVERFVASMGDLPQIFAPGERFSYSNAGFAVLGRLVEVLRGTTWDRALH